MRVLGTQGHLTAGCPGQCHLPLSEDAPGQAAGNFPRHTLFPSRGGAAIPWLFLKAQQAAHPLLFISLPLDRPQPRPHNLAGHIQSSVWPWAFPCLPQLCEFSRGSSISRSGPSPNPPPTRACLMKARRPVPIRQGASLNRERRGLPRALRLAPGPELAEQPHAVVSATGHRQPGVTPTNRGSTRASFAQWAPQAEALGKRCLAAVPGALPATSVPRNVTSTSVGWSLNSTPPGHRSILTVLTAASPLHWHWRETFRGAESPELECLLLQGVSQHPPTYQGPGRNPQPRGTGRYCRGRAPGGSDSQGCPVLLHASPSKNIPKSCLSFPKPGWLSGRQGTSLYSHSLGLRFLVFGSAWSQKTH